MQSIDYLRYAMHNRSEALLWLLQSQRSLVTTAHERLNYWLFFKLFFGSQLHLSPHASVRIHPSTCLLMRSSSLEVESGLFSIGYHPLWRSGASCHIRLERSTLRILGRVDLRPGVNVWAMNAEVVIGNDTVLNGPTSIVAASRVEIGSHCRIARNTTIMDCDMHKHALAGEKPEDVAKQITIRDRCWIGHNVTILKGVTIGEGAIVAAHSVVKNDIHPGTMVGGVPAKTIKDNVIWQP